MFIRIKCALMAGIVLLVLGVAACNEEDAKEVQEACSSSIDALRQGNSITDECRAAIQNLLPNSSNNISSRLTVLNHTGDDISTTLVVAATNSDMSPNSLDYANVTIKAVTANGAQVVLGSQDYTIEQLEALSNNSVAVSLVQDYSGSMRVGDINAANYIDINVLDALKGGGIKGNLIYFSSMVTEVVPMTDNIPALKENLVYNSAYTRTSTSLYDALGVSITSILAQDAQLRFVLISTDGMENSSQTYMSMLAVIDYANQQHVPIVILGSLFADTAVLKQLAEKTGGFYVYARDLTDAVGLAAKIGDVINKSSVVKIKAGKSTFSSLQISVGVNSVDVIL